MTWCVTGLAILGTYLNIKKKSVCFIIWTFTNGFWMVYDFSKGIYAQSFLFLVYFGLAIYGWIEWERKKK